MARFSPLKISKLILSIIRLFPIILETSFQAQFLIPMAISLAYGVLIGTGFILLFFPVLILTINDTKVWIKEKWSNEKVAAEDVEVVVINSKIKVD